MGWLPRCIAWPTIDSEVCRAIVTASPNQFLVSILDLKYSKVSRFVVPRELHATRCTLEVNGRFDVADERRIHCHGVALDIFHGEPLAQQVLHRISKHTRCIGSVCLEFVKRLGDLLAACGS